MDFGNERSLEICVMAIKALNDKLKLFSSLSRNRGVNRVLPFCAFIFIRNAIGWCFGSNTCRGLTRIFVFSF